MEFLELALYGVRNFKSLTRFSFKPGLNLVHGENGTGKTAIQEAIFLILSPEEAASPSRLKSPGSTGECQAGLVMKLKDGRVIRVVRDFGGNKINLAELDSEKKFQIKDSDPAQIAVFLSEHLGGIPSRSLRNLFLITPRSMPSLRIEENGGPQSNGTLPRERGAGTLLPGTKDHAEKTKRLAELKKQLEQADRLSKMEDDLANIQSERAEVSRRIRIVKEKTGEISELDQQFGHLKEISRLPEDYHLIIETAEQQEEVKADTIGSLNEEIEYARQERDLIPRNPFFQDKLFIAGGVTSLVSILAGIILTLPSLFQNLLMVPLLAGFGMMGFVGFKDFLRSNKRKNLEKKIQSAQWKINRIEREFKRENGKMMEILKQTGSPDIPALKEKIKEFEGYMQRRKLLESEQKQYLEEKTTEGLNSDLEDLNKKIKSVEDEMKSAATLSSDIYLMQEEFRKLERELADAKLEASAPEASPEEQTVVQNTGKPLEEKLNHGPDLLSRNFKEGLSIPPIKEFLFSRLPEALSRIKQYVESFGGPIDKRFELSDTLSPILSNDEKKPVPWDTLSAGQRDLFLLATQLGLIQVLNGSFPFPIILDNPLTTLDPRRQKAVLDILTEISQNRQVIFLSSAPDAEMSNANRIVLR